MIETWNPWHGCHKKSEGCLNCYVHYLDSKHGVNADIVTKSKTKYNLPVQVNLKNEYRIKQGTLVMTNMASDFFIEEADEWRGLAWQMIAKRTDVAFMIITKRPERVMGCLPDDWGNGYDNVILMVSTENQERADERIPEMFDLPFLHMGVMAAPLIGEITLEKYLDTGKIEWISVGGENYNKARICNYDWVKRLHNEAKSRNIKFEFFETGNNFVKDGRLYRISKFIEKEQAAKSGLDIEGKEIDFKLRTNDIQMSLEI